MTAAMRTFLREQYRKATKDDVPLSRSQWFALPHTLNVYLRAGRVFNRGKHQFFTGVVVSNIEITVPGLRGQGYFRMFNQSLEAFATKLGYETLSYESVGSDRLVRIMDKHGYLMEYAGDDWPSYFKTLQPAGSARRDKSATRESHV